MVEETQNVPNMIRYDIINSDMDKREFKITVGIRSYWITKEELDKYLRERVKNNVDHVALRGGMLLLPVQYQDVVHRSVIADSEKIDDGRWQCDTGTWHNAGARCYCNVTMIEDEKTRTIRLEERKPGELPAPREEVKAVPTARNRRDTFSYTNPVTIKTF
jgi:hypothetical protein